MSCSTPGGMAVAGHLASRIGKTVEQARDDLHRFAREASSDTPAPTWDEVEEFLLRHRARARSDQTLDPVRRDRIVAHYDDAVALRRAPSPATWEAWRTFAVLHAKLDTADLVAGRRATPKPPLPPPSPITDQQIVAIARTLSEHRVDAVVIGGLAGFLHGVDVARTLDADLCASREPANLRRLAAALNAMGANLRDPHTGRPVPEIPVDTNLFGPSTQTVIFATDHGPVDVAFRPDGTNGYDDLNRNAATIAFRGEPIRVASTKDVIRSKTAADRAKDRDTLAAYERF